MYLFKRVLIAHLQIIQEQILRSIVGTEECLSTSSQSVLQFMRKRLRKLLLRIRFSVKIPKLTVAKPLAVFLCK